MQKPVSSHTHDNVKNIQFTLGNWKLWSRNYANPEDNLFSTLPEPSYTRTTGQRHPQKGWNQKPVQQPRHTGLKKHEGKTYELWEE
jgi:hypothetical protein